MNLPLLIPVKPQLVEKYISYAVQLILTGKTNTSFNKEEKITISRIYKNLNVICKLSLKQVKQIIKLQPMYQQCLADIYFQPQLNNYFLLKQTQKQPVPKREVILNQNNDNKANQIVKIEYRIQFTLSNINKNNIMKPLILLIFLLKNGKKISTYFTMEQFGQLRKKSALSMKQIYGIQLRLL